MKVCNVSFTETRGQRALERRCRSGKSTFAFYSSRQRGIDSLFLLLAESRLQETGHGLRRSEILRKKSVEALVAAKR